MPPIPQLPSVARRMRFIVVYGFAATILPAATIAADLPPQVEAAVQRGAAYLTKSSATADDGAQALVAYSLLSAGRPATDPTVAGILSTRILTKFRGTAYTPISHHIYEAGVDAMALVSADRERYKDQIQTIANYLVQNQRAYGGWDYPNQDDRGDTSITQYGLLGLWAAARAGATVPLRAWDRAAQWHLNAQSRDGAFGYHPLGSDANPKHSMTVAGIGSMSIARLYLTGQMVSIEEPSSAAEENAKKKDRPFGVLERVVATPEQADKPMSETVVKPAEDKNYKPTVGRKELDDRIGRGMGWLGRQFTIDKPVGWPLYYLYGLERAAALTNAEKIGGHDWYKEGYTFLLNTQKTDGEWFDESGTIPATCFALLFLTRATEKIVPNTPQRRSAPATFGGGLLAGGRGLPKDLSAVEATDGQIKAKKLDTPLDRVLAELENPKSEKVESAQAALVEAVLVGDRKQLIGQKDVLLKLSKDTRADVRRTAYWALGRCNDLRVAPVLIQGLSDTEYEVAVEARNALCVLSRRPRGFGLPDDLIAKLPDSASQAEKDSTFEKWRQEDLTRWKEWYQSVRPYDERDKLPD